MWTIPRAVGLSLQSRRCQLARQQAPMWLFYRLLLVALCVSNPAESLEAIAKRSPPTSLGRSWPEHKTLIL